MKTILAALCAVAIATTAAAAQQKIDIRRAATPTVSVRLSGAIQRVTIRGWDKDSMSLTGSVGAGSRLEGGPLNVTGPLTGMKFYVEAQAEDIRNNQLELYVPRKSAVWVKLGSADIDMREFEGGADLNIVAGSIRVGGKPRELIAEAMDGSIYFDGSTDYARIKTASGDIQLASEGSDYTVSSVSGSIIVGDGTYQRARFETVTSSIIFGGSVARGGEVKFETHSGPIELRFKAKTDVEIEAETVTGAIENSLTQGRSLPGRENRGASWSVVSGNGGARVQARSFKGNIRIIKR
jgi:DUF4097 and DUF4098 domain-containing protein YvlB